MTYYYLFVYDYDCDNWVPVNISTDYEQICELKAQYERNWEDYPNLSERYKGKYKIEEREITDSLIYDCDWYESSDTV